MEFIFLRVETDNKQIYSMSGVISSMKKNKAGHMNRGSLGWARGKGCYFIKRGKGSQDFNVYHLSRELR